MRPFQLVIGLLCLTGALAAPHLRGDSDNPKRQGGCVLPSIRLEWRNMPGDQKLAYVQAEACLFQRPGTSGLPGASSRNQDLAAVHQTMTRLIHQNGVFLPWHRFMLFAHESLLRSECGYQGPIPWWDETRDAGAFQFAPLLTPQYFGSITPAVQCVTDGAFAGTMLTIGPALEQTTHCLSRGVNEAVSVQVTPTWVDGYNSWNDYFHMYGCVYGGPHGYGHDAIGGTMADLDSSPGDPMFYMHHGFIDRNWYNWQNAEPARRLYAIGGPVIGDCGDNCTQTTLQTILDMHNIVPSAYVQDMMDTRGGYLCYRYDY